jgi:hypothetical protein
VPNRVDPDGRYDPATPAALATLAERCAPELSHDLRHVDAFAAGRWIEDHAPGSRASLEILALAAALEQLLDLEPRAAVAAEAVHARAPQAELTA